MTQNQSWFDIILMPGQYKKYLLAFGIPGLRFNIDNRSKTLGMNKVELARIDMELITVYRIPTPYKLELTAQVSSLLITMESYFSLKLYARIRSF